MAKETLSDLVVEILKDSPNKKFTSWEIAK
jgi:hypothetical protein